MTERRNSPENRFDDSITPNQLAFTTRHDIRLDGPANAVDASRAIAAFVAQRRELAPPPRQEEVLRHRGL
jgi:hypothetical protein